MTGPLSYSVRTAAEATGLSESHLHRAVRAGMLTARRTSRRSDDGEPTGKYVIFAADLLAYLESLPEA